MLKIAEVSILICLCAHSLAQQTFPYISFMGQTLANHSYVNLSLVGNDMDGNDSVQCHTDLSTCCSGAQGSHRGDWYFPNGDKLPFPGSDAVMYENRVAQKIRLFQRLKGTAGIYRCDVETVAVHGNGVRETVYVGLYNTSEGNLFLCWQVN